jgi:AcrR family transcriptional regulator
MPPDAIPIRLAHAMFPPWFRRPADVKVLHLACKGDSHPIAKMTQKTRYHHGDLRRAALEVAARELDSRGHAAFTLERVAKTLGVTAPALYRHFESRDALLRAVIWDVFLRFVEEMDSAVLAAAGPKEVVRALGHVYVRFALRNPGWFRLQFSRVAVEQHPVPHDEAQPRYPEIIFGALRQILGDDEHRVQGAYLELWALAHGIAALSLEHVWGHVTTDDERIANADLLLDAHVERLCQSSSSK